jgi:hypothetical protein
MQDNTQPPKQVMMHRLKLGLIAVVILVAVAACTALILKSIIPKREASSTSMTVTANETIAFYSVPGAITGLSENLYEQQVYDGSQVPVIYKLPDHEYAVSTMTQRSVLFYGKNSSAQNDVQAIQDQTNVFMQSKGYKRVANISDDSATTPKYATYASETATCQLISSGITADEGVPVSHQLACAENDAIKTEYAQVDKYIHLYTGKQLPSFTLATRTMVTEGNKSFAILKLKNKTKSPTLLFASVKDEWAYVADLNGSGGESNGKYVITPEIKNKLDDPKYNGFLTRYIVGTTS